MQATSIDDMQIVELTEDAKEFPSACFKEFDKDRDWRSCLPLRRTTCTHVTVQVRVQSELLCVESQLLVAVSIIASMHHAFLR